MSAQTQTFGLSGTKANLLVNDMKHGGAALLPLYSVGKDPRGWLLGDSIFVAGAWPDVFMGRVGRTGPQVAEIREGLFPNCFRLEPVCFCLTRRMPRLGARRGFERGPADSLC